MATYSVTCQQDEDGWWVGEVRGVAGVLTQGRSLGTIKRRIRDALSLAVDDAATAQIVLKVKIPPAARKQLRTLAAAQKKLERDQRRTNALECAVARVLTKIMSTRDAGEVLRLTGQRVHQLATEPL